jgi:hypothetical protein
MDDGRFDSIRLGWDGMGKKKEKSALATQTPPRGCHKKVTKPAGLTHLQPHPFQGGEDEAVGKAAHQLFAHGL